MPDDNTNATKINLVAQGKRPDDPSKDLNHGVESVGRIKFLFKHPLLEELAKVTDYAGVKDGVYLTGFKLEDVAISTAGATQNAKLIPMLNGDTMTLTNAIKSGIMTIACTRTSAGITGGDLVAVADFIRSQGDSTGGTLTVSWERNGNSKSIDFKKVCVVDCPPLMYAGNDLPSYGVKLSYATYEDGDYPTWS